MSTYKQSVSYTRSFLMVDSADHITGKTGLTVVVALSKAGSAFAGAGGTVTEIANGWYKIALTTTDTNTSGDLAIHCTSAGADPTDFSDQVVNYDPFDVVRLGLTALPNANAEAAGGLYTRGGGAGQITQDANGRIDVNVKALLGTASAGAAGSVGIDWGQIINKTAAVALTNTTVAGASAPTAAQVATAVWQDLLASSDFSTSSSIGALFKPLIVDVNGRVKALVDVQKNVALGHFTFLLTDSAVHAPLAGKVNADFTLKKERIDSGAAATLSGTITEVDATNLPGLYDISLIAGEINGKVITLYFQTADSDPIVVTLVTSD